uniref:Roadblock/LAMTOR2 domain-containing protein n=2 Tax=Lotharella globosa TaxID=91324 RepID=A0A7S4DVS0_9EUKA|mmetsp:Transcript_15673/g.29582  ORF Transcript_15673/g.29582 Transcript_15673/m.29582 type:complete len:186 (+) Transcript_15673:122-679(+)|eukprot:CAMPEP_0167797706 /NCGR_PEP_ID=MMETSP0111_2-20121227/15824_1 /TAXON_ID=91324 /ORGANISM="Lotharella globosa, Strain CCCM811" /LENGTH=185 /DNA_ID=CAMNT_0007691883 /DNA_START=53 /DNA_END=610 /DNA_ORIENTATION=+
MGLLCPTCEKAEEDEVELYRLLGKICDEYESSEVIAVLGPEGSILIDFWVDGSATTKTQRRVSDQEGKSGVFWTLKKAAEQFGQLMNCSYTPIIHIRGQKYLVSCFHLRTHMLTLISSPSDPGQFNTTDADRKIKPFLQELETKISGEKLSRGSLRSSRAKFGSIQSKKIKTKKIETKSVHISSV